jgi:hypothetical protein
MSLLFRVRCYHDERMPVRNNVRHGSLNPKLHLLTSSTSIMVELEFSIKPLSAGSITLSAAGADAGSGMLEGIFPFADSYLRQAGS